MIRPSGWIPNSHLDVFYVSMQLILFILYIVWIEPVNETPGWLRLVGLFGSLAGLLLVLRSLWELRQNISPFARPVEDCSLVDSGPYRRIRHPVYTGVILLAFGWALHTQNLSRILISLGLWLVFFYKSRYEERLLSQELKGYANYRKRTGRFLPPFPY